jgi:hypothetical protein
MDYMMKNTLLETDLKLLLRSIEDFQMGPNCNMPDGSQTDAQYNLACKCEDVINKLELLIENYDA